MGDPPSQRPAVAEPKGPYRASLVREGDHVEVSQGYPILTMPSSGRHAAGSLLGGQIVDSDPASPGAGVDMGFSSDQLQLRAPDVAVSPHTDAEGWVGEYPPLAIEYAGRYQRENELQERIADLLEGGTKLLWVVRLSGERRVEIHRPGEEVQVARAGERLLAPGVLANPVLVEALWDREAAHEQTLKNLLQRRGYADLDEVLRQGKAEGKAEGKTAALLIVLEARGVPLSEAQRARLSAETNSDRLDRWTRAALTVTDAEVLLAVP